MKSKNAKYMEAESRKLVLRGREVEEMGRCWSRGTQLQLCTMNKSRDLMCNMMTIVNTILNPGNLLTE